MRTWSFTSESVTEGHPDKVCDQIADGILDAILAQDPEGRVACDVSVSTGLVLICGQITTSATVDLSAVARQVLREIGYTDTDVGIDASGCSVLTGIDRQSPDIARGVGSSAEHRGGSSDVRDRLGAGDQGLVFGFACTETPELMPLPITLAHRLARRLADVRRAGVLPYLRPDGKTQVPIEYVESRPRRVDAVVVACQHDDTVSPDRLRRDVADEVVRAVMPASLLDDRTRILVNTAGRFVLGGPAADTGWVGKKIIVDTYGGYARHGGGSFSGKDPTKVDRSAAYAARHEAKNIVAAGLADRCEVQVAYAIGVAHPLSILVDSAGTSAVPDEVLEELVRDHFDLRPAAIIADLDLRRPLYRQTACYGHLGRPDLDLPWERTDKAALLAQAAAGR